MKQCLVCQRQMIPGSRQKGWILGCPTLNTVKYGSQYESHYWEGLFSIADDCKRIWHGNYLVQLNNNENLIIGNIYSNLKPKKFVSTFEQFKSLASFETFQNFLIL